MENQHSYMQDGQKSKPKPAFIYIEKNQGDCIKLLNLVTAKLGADECVEFSFLSFQDLYAL